MKFFKLFRAAAFMVVMLGVWLITIGLLGSVSGFTREMTLLFHSSRNSVGFEDAVVVKPAERAQAGGTQTPTIEASSEPLIPVTNPEATPTPFQPMAEAATDTPAEAEPAETVSPAPTAAEAPVETVTVPLPPTHTALPPAPTATPKPVGPPERIFVPKISLDSLVVSIPELELHLGENVFTHWQAPDFYAAGWHAGSAFLGEPGNTVLSGHNAIYGGVFDHLNQLQQGDEIYLYSGEHTYRYLVSQVMLFEERNASLEQRLENARWITPSKDERITLVSCWPPRSNSHRIMVVGVPVD